MSQQVNNRVVNMHRHQIKIRDYNHELFKDLEMRILTICRVIGITNVPEPKDIQIIVMFLKEHFSDLCTEEISYAFELYCTMKLSVTIESFNSFNARFVSRVLVAYRKYRDEECAKEKAVEEVRQADEERMMREQMTVEEIIAQRDGSNKSWYDNLMLYISENKNQLPKGWNWNAVFFHLLKLNKVLMTPEQIEAHRTRCIEMMKSEELEEAIRNTRITTIREITSSVMRKSTDDNQVSMRMRKEFVINYLKTIQHE